MNPDLGPWKTAGFFLLLAFHPISATMRRRKILSFGL